MRMGLMPVPGGVAIAPTGARAGWVLSQLLDGDELGSQPGHIVAHAHNLEELYGVSPRALVEGNTQKWGTAIEADGGWIQRAGSQTKIGNRWVFDKHTRIYLPAGGPRRPVVATPAPPKEDESSWAWWAGGAAALGALVAGAVAWSKRSKKKGGE